MREPIDIDYDVVVDSAPTSRDTKEKTWQAIGPILQMMQAQGIPPPPEVLDYLPIPNSLAQKIKQAVIQKMQTPDPKQEAMFAAELADKRASAEQKESAAAKNYMDAQQPGIEALAALFGPQQEAAQAPQGQPKQGGDMQSIADAILMSNNQLASMFQQGLQQQNQTMQMLVATLTAPREAVRDESGRIAGSRMRLQ